MRARIGIAARQGMGGGFEHERRRPFAVHQAVAVGVEGAAGRRRVVAPRDRPRIVAADQIAGMKPRADAAGDHRVGLAPLQDAAPPRPGPTGWTPRPA